MARKLVWIKDPIRHSLMGAGMEEWSLLGRLVLEQMLDVAQDRDAVAVVAMAQETAIAGGGVDRFNA